MTTDQTPREEPAPAGPLTDLERAILDLELDWFNKPGSKEQAIKVRLDLTGIRYYQILNRLLDRREAVEYSPVVVNRLRRIART